MLRYKMNEKINGERIILHLGYDILLVSSTRLLEFVIKRVNHRLPLLQAPPPLRVPKLWKISDSNNNLHRILLKREVVDSPESDWVFSPLPVGCCVRWTGVTQSRWCPEVGRLDRGSLTSLRQQPRAVKRVRVRREIRDGEQQQR